MPDDHIQAQTRSTAVAMPAEFTDRRNMALAIWFDDDLFKRATHIADILSRADGITPKHLLGKKEACFFVVEKALTWRLSPSAVAAATYQTPGGKIGYEGKLAQAILEASGHFDGGVTFEHYGPWEKVQGKFRINTNQEKGTKYPVPTWRDEDEEGIGVAVRATIKNEDNPRELRFDLKQAFPRNSTLWPTDPRTQICYAAVRRFASLVVPSIFMGVPFDREDIDDMPMRDITPERPTRTGYRAPQDDADTVTDAEVIEETGEPAAEAGQTEQPDQFALITEDGEEQEFEAAADWANAFYAALKAASSLQAANGLWESNSAQLQRLRDEHSNGAQLADAIEKAFGAAVEKYNLRSSGAAATESEEQAEKDERKNAPRHLGKVPTNGRGDFDWKVAAEKLGKAIETSDTVEDVRAWQEIHMHWLDSIQKNVPEAYTVLQQRIAATTEILGAQQ